MKAVTRSVGTILLLAATTAAEADSARTEKVLQEVLPAHAMAAVERYAKTDLEVWHYTRTWIQPDEILVDRHDPSLPGAEHWQLVSINGRPPTAEELAEYNEDRDNHEDESEDRWNNEDVNKMLAPGSVELLQRADGVSLYGFQMKSPDGKRKRVYSAFSGDLSIAEDAQGPLVEQVRIWNEKPFSPVLGMRLNEASADFTFFIQDGHVLPSRVEASATGRLFLIKKIDRQIKVELSDFVHVDQVR